MHDKQLTTLVEDTGRAEEKKILQRIQLEGWPILEYHSWRDVKHEVRIKIIGGDWLQGSGGHSYIPSLCGSLRRINLVYESRTKNN